MDDEGRRVPWETELIGLLDDWVESGKSPRHPVVSDYQQGSRRASRPLCEYGSYPHYRSGSVASAASFTCEKLPTVSPAPTMKR